MRWRWLTAMAFVLTCNTVNTASAQDLRIEIGLLTCNLALTGEDGKIALVNRRGAEMFGYDREELIGLPIDRLVPPAVRAVLPPPTIILSPLPSTR